MRSKKQGEANDEIDHWLHLRTYLGSVKIILTVAR